MKSSEQRRIVHGSIRHGAKSAVPPRQDLRRTQQDSQGARADRGTPAGHEGAAGDQDDEDQLKVTCFGWYMLGRPWQPWDTTNEGPV